MDSKFQSMPHSFPTAFRQEEKQSTSTLFYRSCLLCVILLLPLTEALATVYKWVDDNGITHFSTTPPAKTSSKKLRNAGSGNYTPYEAKQQNSTLTCNGVSSKLILSSQAEYLGNISDQLSHYEKKVANQIKPEARYESYCFINWFRNELAANIDDILRYQDEYKTASYDLEKQQFLLANCTNNSTGILTKKQTEIFGQCKKDSSQKIDRLKQKLSVLEKLVFQ